MKASRFWAVLALAQPALVVLLWVFQSTHLRFVLRCNPAWFARLAYGVMPWIGLSCVAFLFGNAFAFIALALRNARLGWGMRLWWATALFLFSPVLTPAYWAVHLRARGL